MLMPLSTPLTPPSQSPAGGDLEVGTSVTRENDAVNPLGAVPPVPPSARTDTENAPRPDQDDSSGTEDPSDGRATVTYSEVAGPTPYVALPTVDADDVASAISAAESRARLATAEISAPAPDAQAAQARRYAETAVERGATEERIAAIVPTPENAPSIRQDAQDIRANAPLSEPGMTASG